MPNPLDPEEVKKQIASTRAHLAWLESLLETGEDAAGVEAAPEEEKPAVERAPEVEEALEQDSAETVDATDVLDISEEDMRRMSEGEMSVSNQVAQVRNGCIVLAIIGALLFVAVYWVWSLRHDEAAQKAEDFESTFWAIPEYREDLGRFS